jgi:hypothetical protein
MTIDLSGVRGKIERADEHLNALYAEMQTFFEPYSNRRIVYDVFDRPWHVIVVRPLLDELPPLRLSIICGDAVHNLRTALDHLVWQLVLTEGNEPGKLNSFPRIPFQFTPTRKHLPEMSGLVRKSGVQVP